MDYSKIGLDDKLRSVNSLANKIKFRTSLEIDKEEDRAYITEYQLASSSVGTSGVANNSISTAKIQNSAVTAAKIADGAVDSSEIASGAVDGTHIASFNYEVGTGNLNATSGTATGITVSSSAISGGSLNNSVIGTPRIISGTLEAPVIGTPTISKGNYNNASLGTPEITGGTIHSPTIGTPTISSPTVTGGAYTAPSITGGTFSALVATGTVTMDVNSGSAQLGQAGNVAVQTHTGSAILAINVGGTTFYFTSAGTLS